MTLLALAAMVGLTAPLAHASDEVASYVVQADIAADGVLIFDDGGTGRSVFRHEDDRWRITHIRWSSDAVR